MLMAFLTSDKRRPWLIALFATLLFVGILVLFMTRA